MFNLKRNITDITFTTEIHCHLLPEIDDGFKSYDEAIIAVKNMKKDGYKKIILTPHIDKYTFPNNTEESLKIKYDDFIKRLPSDLKDIEFHLSAEYMVIPDFENNISEKLLCLNNTSYSKKKYILIEMSYLFESNNIKETIFALNMAGYQPVLAHPERYTYYANQLQTFTLLRDMGVCYQLNKMSLSNKYGKESKIILNHLLKNNMYDFIASDLHSFQHYKIINEIKFPKKYFDLITKLAENTANVF